MKQLSIDRKNSKCTRTMNVEPLTPYIGMPQGNQIQRVKLDDANVRILESQEILHVALDVFHCITWLTDNGNVSLPGVEYLAKATFALQPDLIQTRDDSIINKRRNEFAQAVDVLKHVKHNDDKIAFGSSLDLENTYPMKTFPAMVAAAHIKAPYFALTWRPKSKELPVYATELSKCDEEIRTKLTLAVTAIENMRDSKTCPNTDDWFQTLFRYTDNLLLFGRYDTVVLYQSRDVLISKLTAMLHDDDSLEQTFVSTVMRRSVWYHFRLQYLMLLGSEEVKQDTDASEFMKSASDTWFHAVSEIFLSPVTSILTQHVLRVYCNLMLELLRERPVVETTRKTGDLPYVFRPPVGSVKSQEATKPNFEAWKQSGGTKVDKVVLFIQTIVKMSRYTPYSWFGTSAMCIVSLQSCLDSMNFNTSESKVTLQKNINKLVERQSNEHTPEQANDQRVSSFSSTLSKMVHTMFSVLKEPDACFFSSTSFQSTDGEYLKGIRAAPKIGVFAPTYAQDLLDVNLHLDVTNITNHMVILADDVHNGSDLLKLKRTARQPFCTAIEKLKKYENEVLEHIAMYESSKIGMTDTASSAITAAKLVAQTSIARTLLCESNIVNIIDTISEKIDITTLTTFRTNLEEWSAIMYRCGFKLMQHVQRASFLLVFDMWPIASVLSWTALHSFFWADKTNYNLVNVIYSSISGIFAACLFTIARELRQLLFLQGDLDKDSYLAKIFGYNNKLTGFQGQAIGLMSIRVFRRIFTNDPYNIKSGDFRLVTYTALELISQGYSENILPTCLKIIISSLFTTFCPNYSLIIESTWGAVNFVSFYYLLFRLDNEQLFYESTYRYRSSWEHDFPSPIRYITDMVKDIQLRKGEMSVYEYFYEEHKIAGIIVISVIAFASAFLMLSVCHSTFRGQLDKDKDKAANTIVTNPKNLRDRPERSPARRRIGNKNHAVIDWFQKSQHPDERSSSLTLITMLLQMPAPL